MAYVLTGDVDRLSWCRKGLWSAYPEDHIGRNPGVALREGRGHLSGTGKAVWPWSEDEQEFVLFGRNEPGDRGTRDFRSMKENIYYASAILRQWDGGWRPCRTAPTRYALKSLAAACDSLSITNGITRIWRGATG